MYRNQSPKKFKIDGEGRECRICEKYKLWEDYYKTKSGARGHDSACRQCRVDINQRNSASSGVIDGFNQWRQDFTNGMYKGVSS